MSTDPQTRPLTIKPVKLWFGLTASAFAWFGLGLADMFITWRTCLHEEQFANASAHPIGRALYFVFTGLLLGLAIVAGIVSYRNWRKMASQLHEAHVRLYEAEGRERQEFMALLGVFVSFTLGIGMLWMGLPLLILQLCERAR